MLKSYKTEINPTIKQKQKINQTIGTCRFIYNFYIDHNKEMYEKEKRFVSGMEFSKWLNNEYIPQNKEFNWIKEVSSKSVKQSIMNAERAFKRFFNGQSKFPKFKKKKNQDVKMYFVKNNPTDLKCERHRIKASTIGWVRLKEKGYIPTEQSAHIIKSGTISYHAGRYYISVLVEEKEETKQDLNDFGLGIDLGLKNFAIISNGEVYKNINKLSKIKKLEKKLKREQRSFSRKYENKKKGGAAQQNIYKQKIRVQKIYQRLNNIRTDYINKTVNEIVKNKPSYITIENLNVKGMMKNRHLSKAISQQKFYEFRIKLTAKCHINGIELRVVDRFYPSSKMCHNCGQIKLDLKLSDRVYKCDCGYIEDRDLNAALNLRDAITYKIA